MSFTINCLQKVSRIRPTQSRLAALSTHLHAAHPSSSPIPNPRPRFLSSTPLRLATMKAVIIEKTGGPEVLQYTTDAPTPTPKDGEVLIKNHIAGINYIDTYFRSGLYPSASGYPLILGQEASGVVSALGPNADKHGLAVGDRVVWIKMGGYAEYTVCPADKVAKIPSGVSDEDAVGGFLMGMTALSLVQESYPVQKGDWVLVHAAAGGVGLLMCQILRSMGARMIGTAGGPEKCALAKENGAEFVIDYKKTEGPTWVEQVKEITGGRGVDVVYDSVGKDTWEGSLQAIKRKGKVCVFSFLLLFVPSYFYRLNLTYHTPQHPPNLPYLPNRRSYTSAPPPAPSHPSRSRSSPPTTPPSCAPP